jgi:hypothetical protein
MPRRPTPWPEGTDGMIEATAGPTIRVDNKTELGEQDV